MKAKLPEVRLYAKSISFSRATLVLLLVRVVLSALGFNEDNEAMYIKQETAPSNEQRSVYSISAL